MSWLADPHVWASFLTLTALEIVLGVDNLVFIALVTERLPVEIRKRARQLGLALALVTRLGLLASISWLVGLTAPVVTVMGQDFSWRDIILIVGGLFLIYKGTEEIHSQMEGHDEADEDADAKAKTGKAAKIGLAGVIVQIAVLDIVFSLDSVITAVGMADQFGVMAAAIIVAVIIMLVASTPLSNFISAHPTVRMLALGFLLLVGTMLVADGCGLHIPKGYIYAAIGFSILVESLNIISAKRRVRRKQPSDGSAPARH